MEIIMIEVPDPGRITIAINKVGSLLWEASA